MKRSVPEVFFRLLQHAADSFLLGDVVVEFLDVTFGLFSALMLEPGPRSFRFLSQPR
jgi:hypothetical protein